MSLIIQLIDIRPYFDFKTKTTVIQLFGRTEASEDEPFGRSVIIEVNDYKSCFYTKASFDDIEKFKRDNDDIDYEIVKSKRFYGFHGDEEEEFVKVSSLSNVSLKLLSKKLLDKGYEVFESNKDVVVQFIHDKKIQPCGWIEIDGLLLENQTRCKRLPNGEKHTIFDIGYHKYFTNNLYIVNHNQIYPAPSSYALKFAPFIICGYDIEVISCDNSFPLARRKTDEIVSIALTFSINNQDCYKRVCIIQSNKEFKISNGEIITCNNEIELINTFVEVIQKEDPDVVVSWNGFNFDDNYIHERVMRLCGVIPFDDNDENELSISSDTSKSSSNETSIIKKIKKDDYEEEEQDNTFTSLNHDDVKLINKSFPIRLSRFDESTEFIKRQLSSAALGDSNLKYYDMKGRCCVDLMRVFKSDTTKKYISYKLDYIASQTFRDVITKYEIKDNKTIINVDTKDLHNNQYIIIIRNDGTTDYECFDEKKFKISLIDDKTISINEVLNLDEFKLKGRYFICNVKDDVKPKEIFEKYRSGTIRDLKQLCLYNIQDCELLNKLCNKICMLINNMGMSNVCYVPLNWIFNRGQSPKVYSLVSKKCLEENYRIRSIKKKENVETDDFTYEGALVVDPKPGIYQAIFCLDYHALYPSSMICKNISHETYLMGSDEEVKEMIKKYSKDYTFNEIKYLPLDASIVEDKKNKKKNKEKDIKIKSTISISSLFGVNDTKKDKDDKDETEKKMKHCYFAVNKNGKIGLIPEILTNLLNTRSKIQKQMKNEKDAFNKSILNGLQLAYKVTSNSVYGQLGCDENIGPISLKDIAACTTATGREMLKLAQNFAVHIFPYFVEYSISNEKKFYEYCDEILINYNHREDRLTMYKKWYNDLRKIFIEDGKRKYLTKFNIAYGDTDSIFVNMNLRYNNENEDYVYGLELRETYIKTGQIASEIVSGLLPPPEELEYEKILSPFISMAKKRYVGNLYENDATKIKMQYNMGLVLKRRDNARIVKYVVGGVVDRLLNNENLEYAKKDSIDYVKQCLNDLINGRYKMNMFIFSKTLKRHYKHPEQIAHAVLAERIAQRGGDKPVSNDRIDFAFVKSSKNALQGERVETPEYIKENNLKIDYGYYIERQIQKPTSQIISLYDNSIDGIFKKYIDKSNMISSKGKIFTLNDLMIKK